MTDIAGARKDDNGKAPVFRGAISYFPGAIQGVAQVSDFGATKYAWNGWLHVPDGHARYSDALVRHMLYEAAGEDIDPESGLHHDLHAAWNALARAELRIRNGITS